MKINNKEFLNPQQQLYENTKDIEKLKADYQPVYNSSVELYDDDTAAESVLISNTNAPAGTKYGWILDPNGYLFKITDGSTTALLIQYYSYIRGPQGIQGIQGETGATGATPNITVNASVSDTTGTPSVTVTKTGTDENPTLSFAFSNLKGPQGEPGQTTIGIQVVAELPETGEEGVIYFVPKADGDTGNEYDEYTYTNNAWELLGDAQVDLTNYALKSEIPVINENLAPKTHNTYDLGASGLTYKSLWVGSIKNLYLDVSTAGVGGTQGNPNGVATIKTKSGDGTVQSTLAISNLGYSFSNTIFPGTTETIDLGKSGAKFKDLYLSGEINPNSSGYGLSLPATTSLTADKTLATTDQIPTVNDRTITLIQNGVSQSFTLNQNSDKQITLLTVEANPTLVGNESALTGLQVGSTKYSVGGTSLTAGDGINISNNAIAVNDTVGRYKSFTINNINNTQIRGAFTSFYTYITIDNITYTADFNYFTTTLNLKQGDTAYCTSTGYTYKVVWLTSSIIILQEISTSYFMNYTTTAPSNASTIPDAMSVVVLTSEPATYYNGYIYYITEA